MKKSDKDFLKVGGLAFVAFGLITFLRLRKKFDHTPSGVRSNISSGAVKVKI